MSELEAGRFVAFMIITAIVLTPIHEAGHWIFAKAMNMEILEANFIWNPHVTCLNEDSNKFKTALFLAGGLIFLPITLVSYSLIMGNIYFLEVLYLVIVSILGSQTDFSNILKLFF